MHGTTSGLLLSCLVAQAVAAKTPPPATPQEHARALPAVAAIASELADEQTEPLRRYQRALLTRLLLDQGRVAVSRPQALHDATVLAAVCVVVAERAEPGSDDSPLALVRAAYVVHAAGHAYRHRPALRAAVAQLARSARGDEARTLFTQLAASAEGLEALGRRWFPTALHAAHARGEHARELDLLRGLWLEREGRMVQAAEAIGRAVAAKATVASTIDLVRVLAHAGKGGAARKLADQLRARAPGADGVLDAVLQGADDAAGTLAFARGPRPTEVPALLAQVQRYA
ncbi:MAG: hypothetical protein QF464_00240, partial [Myxococcota bacterium]|nr:hypothetical protein [Myxococcota bacterium]